MEIRMITKAEADDIIATREPRGLFYLDTGKGFVGIDNSMAASGARQRAGAAHLRCDRTVLQLRAGG